MVTTFELPGCLDMWTVVGPENKGESKSDKGEEESKAEEKTDEVRSFL